MEPESLLPRSQALATYPYHEPDQSIPCSQNHFLKIHFNIIFPSTPRSSQCFLSPSFHHHNPLRTSRLPIRATCLADLFLLDLIARITLWGVQLIKLLVIYSFPFPCYLVPLRPKYFPQHHILEHPEPNFLTQCERPSFKQIKSKGKISPIVLYILIFLFSHSRLQDKRVCTEL
jgi:hypothetical protein